MTISSNEVTEIKKLIQELFEHIVFENVSARTPLGGYLTIEEPFSINYEGYYGSYQKLMRVIFSIEKLGEQWSDKALEEKIFNLLSQLAKMKKEGATPNYEQITLNWTKGIDIEFKEQRCYVPVTGLVIEKPLEIGKVEFISLENQPLSSNSIFKSSFDGYSHDRDCLAVTNVTAEWQKAAELARDNVENALNVLRYIGSLIWWDRQVGHIHVAGKELKRVSYTLVIDSNSGDVTGETGHTVSTPAPFRVDQEFFDFSEVYGFKYLQTLSNKKASGIEDDLLAAIQWFGYATQELEPLVSFVKYYISIETVLKKEGESARNVLPGRISTLLEPFSKLKQNELKIEIGKLIDERNSVFHEGKVEQYSSIYLATTIRVLAREVINQLRSKIETEGWKTKDDLVDWVNNPV
jgi:hypothetical protein